MQRNNIRSSKGKATSNIQGKTHPICSGSFNRNSEARRKWQDIFKVLKEKNLQPRLLYLAKIFKINGVIKSFINKQNLREFSTTRPTLHQMLKGFT